MKALSGVIVCDKHKGSVVVKFNPHEIHGDDGHGVQLHETGEPGSFKTKPAVMVALREIEAEFHTLPPVPVINEKLRYQIDTSNLTKRNFKISWKSWLHEVQGIKAISYMVIGEV